MIGDKQAMLIDSVSKFCRVFLDDYYERLCINIAKDLANHEDDPLKRGKIDIWAAGVVCVGSQISPMFDKYEKVHTSIKTVCKFFDTKEVTVYSKARKIRELLDIEKVPKQWVLMK